MIAKDMDRSIMADVPTCRLPGALSHPRMQEVIDEVDGYFLQHWPFPNAKAREKFVAAGFSRVTCLYFPKALDDRIHFACRLLTVLFLVDDMLENMSLKEGEQYNQRLMDLSRGDATPDRSIAVEFIIYDLWQSMRSHDSTMANEILEPVFVFMRAQTDSTRMKPMNLGEYFEYRERDVGKALLGSLMCYSMALKISPKELNAARCVEILSRDTNLRILATKRVLYYMCREWELAYKQEVTRVLQHDDTPALRAYLHGLELQMTGNEEWSKSTERYLVVE
ncbi:hypothetical protein FHL15_001225 [Xylaria flabelliformis]|uniref:Aristolochene synthase n=1 Tax=Xylaria flabelliformis TaxID=2512241 RepID=A0A553ICS9_9PEZI|nr:hypothetical protein FHL15_001225 [Xylaria flabelliformis]